mmetsp:Transcript_1620/g.6136  ORF Transcript_1620/g.6136 Transcript_1620/m.6136 type:complete len:205 (-) Transcript_1620:308-922(-)
MHRPAPRHRDDRRRARPIRPGRLARQRHGDGRPVLRRRARTEPGASGQAAIVPVPPRARLAPRRRRRRTAARIREPRGTDRERRGGVRRGEGPEERPAAVRAVDRAAPRLLRRHSWRSNRGSFENRENRRHGWRRKAASGFRLGGGGTLRRRRRVLPGVVPTAARGLRACHQGTARGDAAGSHVRGGRFRAVGRAARAGEPRAR